MTLYDFDWETLKRLRTDPWEEFGDEQAARMFAHGYTGSRLESAVLELVLEHKIDYSTEELAHIWQGAILLAYIVGTRHDYHLEDLLETLPELTYKCIETAMIWERG